MLLLVALASAEDAQTSFAPDPVPGADTDPATPVDAGEAAASVQAPTAPAPRPAAPAPAAIPAPVVVTAPPVAPVPSAASPATAPTASIAEDSAPPLAVLGEAEPVGLISKRELRQLRPSPFRLPPNPRMQVDFTAHTLEWGEVKLGVTNVALGLFPHTQVGTSAPLYALGIPNVNAKVHVTEKGPVDFAAQGSYFVLPQDKAAARFYSAGGLASVIFNPYWSVHVGGGYSHMSASGAVDIAPLMSFLPMGGLPEGIPTELPFSIETEMVTASVATDVRFNRRDSIVLRGESVIWAQTSSSGIADPLVRYTGIEDAADEDGWVAIDEAYTASLSYQFTWENLQLRVGGGVSSAGPLAWILQSAELSYRFGGPTHNREAKMRRGHAENVATIADERAAERRRQREERRDEAREEREREKAGKRGTSVGG
jgi:hypothetical protein